MQPAPDTTGPWHKLVTQPTDVTTAIATNVRREAASVRVLWNKCVTKPAQVISGAAIKIVLTDVPETTAIVTWVAIRIHTVNNFVTTAVCMCVSTEVGVFHLVPTDVTTIRVPNRRSVTSVYLEAVFVTAIHNESVPRLVWVTNTQTRTVRSAVTMVTVMSVWSQQNVVALQQRKCVSPRAWATMCGTANTTVSTAMVVM
jgi:hypothetical protein